MTKPLQRDKVPKAKENIRIVITRGVGAPVVRDLTPDSTIIVGNSPTCGILVAEPGVSPIQCMLALHSNEPELQPWPTAGGTLLNGVEVTNPTVLKNGDVINIGDCVLKVEFDGSVCASSQPSDESVLAPARQEASVVGESRKSIQLDRQQPPLQPPQLRELRDAQARQGEDSEENRGEFDIDHREKSAACEDSVRDESYSIEHEANTSRRDFARSEPVFRWDEDAEDDETMSFLRAEIVELQSELAERDAQLEEFLAAESNEESSTHEGMGGADSLIARIDDLLLELNESDERLSVMETMLSASETANRAEREERRQLESWVGDIEQRIAENQAVRDAEFRLLQNQLDQMKKERDKAESQLAASARSNGAKHEHENLLSRLREENASLQQQLTETESQRKSLEDRLNLVEVRNTEEAQQTVVNQVIREERAKIATQQAQLARERAELASKLAQIEQTAERGTEASKIDDRVTALREHLKEIHQQEGVRRRITTDTDENGGLMSRIVGLWNKLD